MLKVHRLKGVRGFASLTITDPLVLYQSRVKRGLLLSDGAQLRAMAELQRLHYRVKDYTPPDFLSLELQHLMRQLQAQKTIWRPMRTSRRKDLIRVVSDKDLGTLNTPHGLLLNGDVGTGKTMLVDIFAHSLPKQSKQRWHYQNFMLWIYDEIHRIYKQRLHHRTDTRDEFILFEIAQKLVKQSTVLILDEFMLPDLAAAKIIKLLFTYFFKLGGVLVATSNRMPEDLYATDFKKNEFRSFLSVLQSRCYTIDIESEKDYRHLMSEQSDGSNIIVGKGDLCERAGIDINDGNSTNLTVYGRQLQIPWHKDGTLYFDFNDICAGLYGPGDYISLASNYHSFIIDNVPVLKLNMKNEARRFITLLDALYECKCQLYLQLETHPDDLFFPDLPHSGEELNRIKVQEEEVFSKTHIALTAPYRPNISYYDDEKIQYKEGVRSPFDLSETTINYANQKTFTGEDERFAYKRALSRLKEMTSDRYKEQQWAPLQKVMRPWERTVRSPSSKPIEMEHINHASKPGPSFRDIHFWSMGFWGNGKRLNNMAKKWIKGVDN